MPSAIINDLKHWRERAAEMRVIADTMNNIETVGIMLRLADEYDRLSDRAETRSNGGVPVKPK